MNCPTCREPAQLPEGGIPALPPSFLINNLLDLQQKTPNTSRKSLEVETAVSSCPDHDKPLDMYCNDCDKSICQHCVTRQHRGHVCDLGIDVYEEKCLKPMGQLMSRVDDKIVKIDGVMQCLAKGKETLNQQCDRAEQEVNDAADEMVLRITQERQRLLNSIEHSRKVKSDAIRCREKKALELKNALENPRYSVAQFMQDNSQLEILAFKDKLMKHLSVDDEDEMESINPKDEFEISFTGKEPPEIYLGEVKANLPPLKRRKTNRRTLMRKFEVSRFLCISDYNNNNSV